MRRTGKVLFTALVLAALIPTAASATVICHTPQQADSIPGFVWMLVTSTVQGAGFINVQEGPVQGGATIDVGTCLVGENVCAWGAQGTPGGPTPQSASVAFQDADGTVVCSLSDEDGLPVELIDLSLE